MQGHALPGISKIAIAGFKALGAPIVAEVRPLTILAGANSAGKSSLMQSLLLMKQTMDSSYNPDGAILLDGPHVRFTSAEQVLSTGAKEFTVSLSSDANSTCQYRFKVRPVGGFELAQVKCGPIDLTPDLNPERLAAALSMPATWNLAIRPDRCIFEVSGTSRDQAVHVTTRPGQHFLDCLSRILHVPGLRGSQDRNFKNAKVGPQFAGPFDLYVASVLHSWSKHPDLIGAIDDALAGLSLNSSVVAKKLDEASIEITVKSSSSKQAKRVSVADVGLGVGQILPVLVGLRFADAQHLVYIEQPEIHLHPRAQHALAKPFAEAAKRKVTTVVETHSSLFLLGIQSLIAKDELDPKLVILHWFERDPKTGISSVKSVTPDKTGVFENWPVDFDDVSLQANREFIKASFAKSKAK